MPQQGDLDGRGNLSQKGLIEFMHWFLEVCLDQVNFMSGLFPCYGGNGLRGYTKTFTHDGHFPLIGRQGALCGNERIVHGKFHATEHAVVVKANASINVNWLYHQLKLLNLNQYATGVAQPGLSVQKILNVSTVSRSTHQRARKFSATNRNPRSHHHRRTKNNRRSGQ